MVSTDTSKQNSLETLVIDFGIYGTAKVLSYTYAYIHQVYSGKMPITDTMKKRIANFTRRPRHHLSVDFETREELERAMVLSMKQRREILLEATNVPAK